MLDAFAASPAFAYAAAAVFGLVVGSFLNVVIHRLPLMLERAWQRDCGAEIPAARFDLAWPRSHCPACGHRLRAAENVPLLSWLAQRGRCRACGAAIPGRYPLVELGGALVAAAALWRFGLGPRAGATMLLGWALLALAVIDLRTQLLPDAITQPWLWLGLLFALAGVTVPLADAVIGAMAGYLTLWSVYQAFRLATGREGMGYGDFKLLAMLGAWQGWQMLPAIVLLSSLVGAVVGVALIAARRHERAQPLPFGPFLAAAGAITALWGHDINAFYLRSAGL